jgi:hypothetical protein
MNKSITLLLIIGLLSISSVIAECQIRISSLEVNSNPPKECYSNCSLERYRVEVCPDGLRILGEVDKNGTLTDEEGVWIETKQAVVQKQTELSFLDKILNWFKGFFK